MRSQQELTEIVPELLLVEEKLKKVVCEDLSAHPGLSQPLLKDVQGKKLRPALFLASARSHWDDLTELIPLAASLELIHLATLLHDDVIDNATLRRNLPAVNVTAGNKMAVLLGDYYFSKAFSLLSSEGNTEIITLFACVVEEMSLGEIQQERDSFKIDLTETDYLERTRKKTALFMASCCLASCLISETTEELKRTLYHYGLNLGMAFQIIDDLLDFRGNTLETGKNCYADIINGVITLPLIHVLQEPSNADLMQDWILAGDRDRESLEALMENINIDAGLHYAVTVAEQYMNKASCFAEMVPSRDVVNILQKIIQNMLGRSGYPHSSG